MKVVIVDSFKTRKTAEKYAALLASADDGVWWNGGKAVEIGSLNFRAQQNAGAWLVVRDWCVADVGREVATLASF